MSECENQYYMHNNNIENSDNFNDNILKNGVCIYEVIRVINGIPLFFEDHMERLTNSFKVSNIKFHQDAKILYTNIKKLISKNKVENGNIKIVFNFSFKDSAFPNSYIYFILHHYPSVQEYKNGVKTILYQGERSNPNAKVINSSFREKVNEKIKNSGAYEAILVDNEGNITEGSKSNIFFVKNNIVYTAPLVDVLPGVTRKIIIQVCCSLNINVKELCIKRDEIQNMDALFISGTSPKVLPISMVENIKYNSTENVLIQNITKGYEQFIENYIKRNNFNEF